MLEPIAADVWMASRSLRFLGLDVGTRMTVVRLADGALFVHSPLPLDAATREEVSALGPVKAIVAPCLFHHLYAGDWAKAFPDASISGCPGLAKKRSDVAWTRVLGDDASETEWKGELDQVLFSAYPLENEVVFFHRASRTMISSDLIFNLATHPSAFTRAVATMIGNRTPGPTLLERLGIRDRAAAKEQIARMVTWNAERIVLAHGDIVRANGAELLEGAYRWL